MAPKPLPDGREDERLSPAHCRDQALLRSFVEEHVSPNAWPIQSRRLRRAIAREGLDLARARDFALSEEETRALVQRFESWGRRIQRWLGADLAYHHLLHNFEVTLRLLALEWPLDREVPDEIRASTMRAYRDTAEIRPVLLETVRRLAEIGVPGRDLARDLLAGLGHDYGHSGGTDRVDQRGVQTPLTHEETAERHVAGFGLDFGFPPSLVLEAMAGIRATTFHRRVGRSPVAANNDFERKITLADVAGCALPNDAWLTHVSVPVLQEKLPAWRRRRAELPWVVARVREEIESLRPDDPARDDLEERLEQLEGEKRQIIEDLPEVYRGERGFLYFIRDERLAKVEGAERFWGETIEEKIALIDEILGMDGPLEDLRARGFEFLETYADALAGRDLREFLAETEGELSPQLRGLLEKFLPADDDQR